VVDAETDPFHNCSDVTCAKCSGLGRVPKDFLWGAYEGDSEQYLEFTDCDELIDFFERQKTTVYAHNGGKFDYHLGSFRQRINSDEPIMVINGRLAKFKIGNCEFRDSLNLFPNTKLSDFNDDSGAKLEIDYALFEADRRNDPNTIAEIKRYLNRDCTRLWHIIRRYWDQYGKSLTQAGSSLKYWEKMYEIKAPRQTKVQHDRYKPFYYGGRVQCFAEGNATTDFKVADINSAYPEAMLREHMFSPEAMRETHLPPEPDIYKCLIECDAVSRGAFPWRDPDTHELFFPDDEAGNRNRLRRYTITGWEFITALELDSAKIFNIRSVHHFPITVNFKRYIDHFYAEREACRKLNDVAGRTFCKYFMNGLYGKLGSDCSKYAEYLIASTDTVEDWINGTNKSGCNPENKGGYQIYQPWGDRFLLCRTPLEAELNDITGPWKYYNVATAASVTGYVRAKLFKALKSCSGVLYCDTDSVAARDTSSLTFGTALGDWKDEGEFDGYSIAGKKLYAFHKRGAGLTYDPKANEKDRHYKIASKGVDYANRADAPDILRRIAAGELNHYVPEAPCFTITRETARFISRDVKRTVKDMSIAPDMELTA